MGRDVMPLFVADVSAFSKNLRQALAGQVDVPGHQAMLDLVAKAAGSRNLQQLRAQRQADAGPRADILRLYDEAGRFCRWPGKTSQQRLALWVIWSRMAPRVRMGERAFSAFVDDHAQGVDAAQIRRAMVEHRLVTRARDGSDYERIERAPDPEALALIRALGPLR